MHFVQHGLREFLTRPRDYSPVVAKHLLFDPDGLLATAALIASYLPKYFRKHRAQEADLRLRVYTELVESRATSIDLESRLG